jgi:hypothetical protein
MSVEQHVPRILEKYTRDDLLLLATNDLCEKRCGNRERLRTR